MGGKTKQAQRTKNNLRVSVVGWPGANQNLILLCCHTHTNISPPPIACLMSCNIAKHLLFCHQAHELEKFIALVVDGSIVWQWYVVLSRCQNIFTYPIF